MENQLKAHEKGLNKISEKINKIPDTDFLTSLNYNVDAGMNDDTKLNDIFGDVPKPVNTYEQQPQKMNKYDNGMENKPEQKEVGLAMNINNLFGDWPANQKLQTVQNQLTDSLKMDSFMNPQQNTVQIGDANQIRSDMES